jgi:hypothetical protein
MWFIYIIIGILLLTVISKLVSKYIDNRKYIKLLGTQMKRVEKINVLDYLNELDNLNKYFTENKIVLKDNNGSCINICSKCGQSMKVVHHKGKSFLGCSNYPICSSYKKYDNIFKIKF